MIKPLTLGKQNFPTNLIQAPLAGVSCAPFRLLAWQHSRPAFSCTEMISCKTILHQPKLRHRYLHKDPKEGPVCFQLSATEPAELANATQIVTQSGADLIDLNCGCPVDKIRRKGAGSSLLQQPGKLYQLITAMKQNTHVPVSIKIRVDGHSSDKFNQDIVNVVRDTGLDYLIVHGRHWTERYETPCNYQQIKFFVDNLTIPVIGNGDVACVSSLQAMLATGCAGVMIGRAAVGQPWLIKQLQAQMNGEEFILPSLAQIAEIFLSHVTQLIRLLGSEKLAVLQARKLAKYYARHLAKRIEFTIAVNQCHDFSALQQVTYRYLTDVT